MKTWRRQPRQTKHEPEDISTLVRPCGAVKRQIDYITVNKKYRNCARKAYAIQEWRANQEQRHHAAVKLEICLHLKKQYCATPKQDTGNEVGYNLKHLSDEPTLLEQYCEKNQN